MVKLLWAYILYNNTSFSKNIRLMGSKDPLGVFYPEFSESETTRLQAFCKSPVSEASPLLDILFHQLI